MENYRVVETYNKLYGNTEYLLEKYRTFLWFKYWSLMRTSTFRIDKIRWMKDYNCKSIKRQVEEYPPCPF